MAEQHCMILAAGIAMPAIEPYTQSMPKCFLPIAGRPILHHIVKAFVEQGVSRFTIVIGAHAQYFDNTVRADLLDLINSTLENTPSVGKEGKVSLDFVLNEFFWNNGPADSLKIGHHAWKEKMQAEKEKTVSGVKDKKREIFVCYGDTVFTDVALTKLVQSPHANSVVVDRAVSDADLKNAKSRETGFQELELCSVHRKSVQGFSDSVLVLDQMGKHLLSKSQAFGEFSGLFKIEEKVFDMICSDGRLTICSEGKPGVMNPEDTRFNEDAGYLAKYPSMHKKKVPTTDRFIPDLLRKVIELGSDHCMLVAVPIFGNRREIHSVTDLLHADTELCYLSDQAGRRAYIRSIGSRLLAEANDLKRPLEIIAAEMNFPDGILEELLKGNVELDAAQEILRKVNCNYPVSLNSLWVEPDDTDAGVRVFRADQAQASRRVLNRINKDGFRTPYYEYRDCAMSRLGPFRPEWIEELRSVTNNSPLNPDVSYNNGHLLFQSTFFIGPVNFYFDLGSRANYYKENILKSEKVTEEGGKFCAEMNTGDSNWIAPFVPHTFTSRDPEQFACIIACTYGAGIVTSLQQLGGLHPDLEKFSGDVRDPLTRVEANLCRFMENDCLTKAMLVESMKADAPELVRDILGVEGASRLPTLQECRLLAKELHCLAEDLYVDGTIAFEDVVVQHHGEGAIREQPGVRFERLASSTFHSQIKSFELEIKSLAPAEGSPDSSTSNASPNDGSLHTSPPWIQIAMHQFIYNYSEEQAFMENIDVHGKAKWVTLQPNDSLYLQPNVKQRFWHRRDCRTINSENRSGTEVDADSGENPRLFIVRIPGDLTKDLMFEVSLCDQRGKNRVGKETIRWYS